MTRDGKVEEMEHYFNRMQPVIVNEHNIDTLNPLLNQFIHEVKGEIEAWLAVNEAKVRLNLAVCPGTWLMQARMVINTGSIVGYNNKLKQAKAGMKLGINNDVNLGTKKAALQLMDGGPSKINPFNSHPSNPIHKAAMAAQNPKPALKTSDEALETPTLETKTAQHEINKTAVIVGVVGVVALLFMAMR